MILRNFFRKKKSIVEQVKIDTDFCLSLTDESFVQNPYPYFTFLRHNAPLHRSQSGNWVLTAYEDIHAALKDERLGNAPSSYSILHHKNAEKYYVSSVANNIIPFIDTPQHTCLRKPIARTFAKQLSETSPLLADYAQLRCQQLQNHSLFDVISDFGTPFSIDVMMQFLGFSTKDYQIIKKWSQDFIYLFSFIPSEETLSRIERHLQAFRQFCLACIEEKKQALANDWLSKIIQLRSEEGLEGTLTDTIIADNAMLLFVDGIENVDRGIGTAVSLLLRHPEQLDSLLLEDNESKWKNAINECFRYESPAQFVGRVAKEDIRLYGQTIKKGQVILLMLASANRDESIFDSPDEFDINRNLPFYLSFGRGRHACIGGQMVRQETLIAVRKLLETFPHARLRDKHLLWELRMGHRWLQHTFVSV